MSSDKPCQPAAVTDHAKAFKQLEAHKGHIRGLTSQLETARCERDIAEQQARALTRELQAARREIARLQSLAPRQQDN